VLVKDGLLRYARNDERGPGSKRNPNYKSSLLSFFSKKRSLAYFLESIMHGHFGAFAGGAAF
jgi:hypothetical protein